MFACGALSIGFTLSILLILRADFAVLTILSIKLTEQTDLDFISNTHIAKPAKPFT